MGEDRQTCFNKHSVPPDGEAQPLPPPALEIDMDEYLAEIGDSGLSEEQQAEFLSTLAVILWHFIDLGFRVDISELSISGGESDAVDSKELPKLEKRKTYKNKENAP